MNTLFKPEKDSPIADIAFNPGFDTKPLLDKFGKDVTWRQIFLTDKEELISLPGYGRKTIDKINTFLNSNFDFTFSEFLSDK